MSVWALGYDDGSPQTWNLLRASFAAPVKVVRPGKVVPVSRGPLTVLYGIRHVLLLSVVVITGFLLIGLLLDLFLRSNVLVPNPASLSVVSVLVALCGLSIALYLIVFGQLIITTWILLALTAAVLLLLLLVYQRYWRQQILP